MSNRDNLRPFKPGQSGNPGGRPRGSGSLTSTMAGLLDPVTKEKLCRAVLSQAARGNGTAMKLVWDRMDGRAPDEAYVAEMNEEQRNARFRELGTPMLYQQAIAAYEEDGEELPEVITTAFGLIAVKFGLIAPRPSAGESA